MAWRSNGPLLLLLAALLGGCASSRPPTVPMRTITEPARCPTRPDTLVVLLPGSYSLPEEFQTEGFVQAARQRGLAADLLLVDSHMAYFNNRSVVDRLHADVIEPARAQGYRRIWLVGISLGAVGSMLYAEAHADAIDGVVMIAPFLGSRLTALEIRNAGGLAAWAAPAPAEGDIDGALWRFLQSQTGNTGTGRRLPLVLGYGLDDRFVYNDRVLAEAMPRDRVFTADGGHDWPAWIVLWRQMLDALPLPRDAACMSN